MSILSRLADLAYNARHAIGDAVTTAGYRMRGAAENALQVGRVYDDREYDIPAKIGGTGAAWMHIRPERPIGLIGPKVNTIEWGVDQRPNRMADADFIRAGWSRRQNLTGQQKHDRQALGFYQKKVIGGVLDALAADAAKYKPSWYEFVPANAALGRHYKRLLPFALSQRYIPIPMPNGSIILRRLSLSPAEAAGGAGLGLIASIGNEGWSRRGD